MELMGYKVAKVGMKVVFGRVNGEQTLGEVVKINTKSLKVRQLEGRGSHPVGTVWSVAPVLCIYRADDGKDYKLVGKPLSVRQQLQDEMRREAIIGRRGL